jgi:hypothetical protein
MKDCPFPYLVGGMPQLLDARAILLRAILVAFRLGEPLSLFFLWFQGFRVRPQALGVFV